MRVNHAGEIAAQALYHGQAMAARSDATRRMLLDAAREETDHLAWCESRLEELQSRPSLLNPLWYAGSFFIGALAALAGDRTSLGFVMETERQVEGHLDDHLGRLPAADLRSRAIVQQMRVGRGRARRQRAGRRRRGAARSDARAHAPHGSHHDGHRLLGLIATRSMTPNLSPRNNALLWFSLHRVRYPCDRAGAT